MTNKRSESETVKRLVAYLRGMWYKKTEDRRQTTEDGGQKTEDRINGSCGIKNSDTEVVGPD